MTWAAQKSSLRAYPQANPRRRAKNKVFALTLFLILAAYATGAMRYCVFTFQKPEASLT
jgi:hypothetical protein